jgi:small-conductance mechanosensitive channel
MSDLFTAERLIEIGNSAYQWLLANVFVPGNAVQLLVIAAAFGVALLLSRRVNPLLARIRAPRPVTVLIGALLPLVPALLWLLLQWLTIVTADALEWPNQLLGVAASLLTAWIAIRLVSQLAPNAGWAKAIAWAVWFIAALSILNLLAPTIALLDSAAVTLGSLRISVYTIIKTTLILAVSLSLAIYLTGLLESRIRTSRSFSPSVQMLFTKTLKAVLIGLSILIAINSVGIDLTGVAVVGGALGLGAGFGLQRVISNMVSGVVLLLDKSIRPGDVISVSGTYGWVTALGGRYVSVVTRDGVEHMIPNETLISERVENWTHTNSHTRLKIPVRVHYDTDVHQAINICLRAASQTKRVLAEPECKCLLVAFGDNGLDLEVRIWIGDAHNGVQNVKSEVLLKIWDMFREAGIKIPYPHRDVYLRPGPEPLGPVPPFQSP